jgi:hypothetical protein
MHGIMRVRGGRLNERPSWMCTTAHARFNPHDVLLKVQTFAGVRGFSNSDPVLNLII